MQPGETHNYAGFWLRVATHLLDEILLGLPVLLLSVLVVHFGYDAAYTYWQGFPLSAIQLVHGTLLLAAVAGPLTLLFFWYRWQATPGKMLLGLKITTAHGGGKPPLWRCALRLFGYLLSWIISMGLIFLWIPIDTRKQGWHDKLAGTVVVRKKHASAHSDESENTRHERSHPA